MQPTEKIMFMKARKSSIYIDDNGEYNTSLLQKLTNNRKTILHRFKLLLYLL